MSLINEALKKARIEAAQRDAAQRGVLVPKAAAYAPRRRTGRIAAAAAAGVLALALAVAAGMWLAGRAGSGGDGTETVAGRVAMGDATATGSAPAAGGAGVLEAQPELAPSGSEASGTPGSPPTGSAGSDGRADNGIGTEPTPGAGASAPPRGDARPLGDGAGEETASPSSSRADPASRRSAGDRSVPERGDAVAGPPPAAAEPVASGAGSPDARPAGVPSYLREAPLPGGGTLRLDGIAWSETTPAAVIDGQIVGPGERIHGARVVEVERDRVVLEVDGESVVVRLR